MSEISELWDAPAAKEIFAIAGWEQWANAGSVSSDLTKYLVDHLKAKHIGRMKGDGFYLFQLPATHDLMRPHVEFTDGHHTSVQRYFNDVYYWGDEEKGLVIFTGCEPHIDVDRYAVAFFEILEALRVKRTVGIGGVFGDVPFRFDRNVSCVYSLPNMREELTEYAVNFSNYKGGASLGSYLAVQAKEMEIEYCTFYSLVPAYDLSKYELSQRGLRVDVDFRAWHEVMRRINVMFNLQIDLSDLEERSHSLTSSLETKFAQLSNQSGGEKLERHFNRMEEDFEEKSFLPFEGVWEDELGDILDELNDNESRE